MVDWVLGVVGGVGSIVVVGLVSGLLVGVWLGWVLVWCGCCVRGLCCRFRIWCVMVSVGWRLRGALLGFRAVCGMVVGCGWGCVVGLDFAGGRWWADCCGDRLVLLAVRDCWRGLVVWVGAGAVVWWAGMRVSWRRWVSVSAAVWDVLGGALVWV